MQIVSSGMLVFEVTLFPSINWQQHRVGDSGKPNHCKITEKPVDDSVNKCLTVDSDTVKQTLIKQVWANSVYITSEPDSARTARNVVP